MTFTPAPTPLNPQQQGNQNFLNVCEWNDCLSLAANVAQSYSLTTLKTNAALKSPKVFLVFAADGPFWANFHGTAAIPSGAVTNGTASEYSPNQRFVELDDPENTETAISFIAPAATNISIQVFIP